MPRYILLTAFLVALLTSCVRSLYPISENEKDMVFKKELPGVWKDKDGSRYVINEITSAGIKAYRVEIIDTSKTTEGLSDTSYFIAALINIKGKLFFDCIADMDQLVVKKVNESAINSLLPTHTILRVFSIQQNSIELASIDKDEFSSLVQQKKVIFRHESMDKDDLLLTEKPQMFQQKLLQLENFPAIYKDRTYLIRVK